MFTLCMLMGLSHRARVDGYELHSPDQDDVRINTIGECAHKTGSVLCCNSEPPDDSNFIQMTDPPLLSPRIES
jgi:hypothetical protein